MILYTGAADTCVLFLYDSGTCAVMQNVLMSGLILRFWMPLEISGSKLQLIIWIPSMV